MEPDIRIRGSPKHRKSLLGIAGKVDIVQITNAAHRCLHTLRIVSVLQQAISVQRKLACKENRQTKGCETLEPFGQ
jgi:hypothetical protein